MIELQAFVTSIFHDNLDIDCESNVEYIKSFQAITPTVERSNTGGWQSPPQFNEYENKNIAELFELKIKPKAASVINHMQYSKQFNSLTYWYNVNTPYSYNMPHCHPRSILSGVLYLKVPENSGNIVFLRPDNESQAIGEISNFTDVKTTVYTHGSYWIKPEEGKLILFPPYLSHYVEQNRSAEDRISMAFNFGYKE
jgi:uncharacterized protein (TIGR02466 family)